MNFFLILLFTINSLFSVTCKEAMSPIISWIANSSKSIKIPKELFNFIDFPKYDLEEQENIPNYFPKPKSGISTTEMDPGTMAELVVYHNSKTKKNILLKKYDDKKDMDADIERLKILNKLLRVSGFKNINAVTYVKLNNVSIRTYKKYFSINKKVNENESTVISYNFINRINTYYADIDLKNSERIITKRFIKQTFIDFITLLNTSQKIQKETPYSNFTLELIIDGTMLYPRIKFINTKTKQKYILVPHSKNLIIDKSGIIHIIDPF